MASRSELAAVLRSGSFRKLFGIRLTGQFFDGFFQSALATFVLFSPERQPTAASIAIAFAVLYLPYSFIGPFAGVLLDRWSRRQVLLIANLARATTVIGIAWLTSNGRDGVDLAIVVLIALGFNRFILAALSAALPHTVEDEALVTANALSPTVGTICAALGGLVGIGAQRLIGSGDSASTTVLLISVVGFAGSGLLALRLGRTSLGPTGEKPSDSFVGILHGFIEGAVVLWTARPAFRAVTAVTLCRMAFGTATALVIVMVRNTLNSPATPEVALGQISLIIGGAAGGALLAAVITPSLSRRFGPVAYSSALLALAGVVTTAGLYAESLASFIVGGAMLGLASQATKICADTLVQHLVHDDHLGRVFALYDVAVNVALVVGVTFAAIVAPASGESVVAVSAIAVILLGTALWYAMPRPTKPALQ